MDEQCIAVAEDWLGRSIWLQQPQRRALAQLTPALLQALPAARPSLIGIAGPPGTGKSTLAGMLCAVLQAQGRPCAVLSLDDYYLPRRERLRLARDAHPLCAVRGAPGTHDLELLLDHVRRLLHGDALGLELPCFDKASDDRLASGRPWAGPAPEIVFLEGWCIGCPAPERGTATQALNRTENDEDPDGRWRRAMLQAASHYQAALNPQLARRWYLAAPDWDAVLDWRWQQEQELGTRRRLRSRAEVAAFLGTFERLCRHMQASCAAWADRVIRFGHDHRPLS